MSVGSESNPSELPANAPRGWGAVRELLAVGMPTILQMASYTALQFTDTLMLAIVGDAHATAAGNAGTMAFAFIGFGVGMMFCVNTVASQAFGGGRYRECGPYLWQGLWLAAAFSLLLLPLIALSPRLWSLLEEGHTPELLAMESAYFQWMIAGTLPKLASTALGQFMLATNRPRWVLVAALGAVVTNIVGNYLLIYGTFGFPAMGAAGAAIATVFATCVEVAILAAVVFAPGMRRKYAATEWRPRAEPLRTLARMGVPSGLQLSVEVLAWGLFNVLVIGALGKDAMAAQTYIMRYMLLSFMPAWGLSAAATTLVGRYIGAGRPDVAAARGHLAFGIALIYMVACGVLMVAFRQPLVGVFTADAEVARIAVVLMLFAGVYQVFDAMYAVYVGALRGAGDTLVPAIVTGVLVWVLTVGGGIAAVQFLPGLGVAGPWIAVMLYGLLLGAFLFVRFYRGRWKQFRITPGMTPAAH